MVIMKEIRLSKNKFALVDDEDFEWLNKYKWYFNGHYAVRHILTNKVEFMHRIILNTPKNKFTDHINKNKLDNRRINLRIASKSQNRVNSFSQMSKSGFRGVRPTSKKNGWFARIGVDGKRIYLGFFKNKIEAARAYNKAANEYFGDFANLNNV